MGDYEHSTTVAAEPDTLFRYLSDVHNLPDYFDSMREAEPTGSAATGDVPGGAEEVHVVADVDGERKEGEAWFDSDPALRSLRWGSEGLNGYHGELSVNAAAEGSEVTVTLHTEHVDGERIRAGLEHTLAEIKQKVESPTNPS
ncbi:SRPBCC family protein [Pseudonocardia halophobica]|uniref:SRPBCC family protein n=1 Tax=Pseudonocardia halophobica TaxID=29401 RepID=UPI003D8CCE6E